MIELFLSAIPTASIMQWLERPLGCRKADVRSLAWSRSTKKKINDGGLLVVPGRKGLAGILDVSTICQYNVPVQWGDVPVA